MFPMAMLHAKKKIGNDVWGNLSSEEKREMTNIELVKLLN